MITIVCPGCKLALKGYHADAKRLSNRKFAVTCLKCDHSWQAAASDFIKEDPRSDPFNPPLSKWVPVGILVGLVCLWLWIPKWFIRQWALPSSGNVSALVEQSSRVNDISLERPGQFGDTFGTVNALFSALALGGIIFTILLQRTELGLQRQELEATREELQGQRKQLEKQEKAMVRQNFENAFFNLLDRFLAHRAIHSESFDIFKEDILKRVHVEGGNDKKAIMRTVAERYWSFYFEPEKNRHQILGPYFRLLYHILKFVNDTPQLSATEMKFYTNILRAHLTQAELFLLFFNCFDKRLEEGRLKPLVEKFAILKHLDPRDIPVKEHFGFYLSGAFSGGAGERWARQHAWNINATLSPPTTNDSPS